MCSHIIQGFVVSVMVCAYEDLPVGRFVLGTCGSVLTFRACRRRYHAESLLFCTSLSSAGAVVSKKGRHHPE